MSSFPKIYLLYAATTLMRPARLDRGFPVITISMSCSSAVSGVIGRSKEVSEHVPDIPVPLYGDGKMRD